MALTRVATRPLPQKESIWEKATEIMTPIKGVIDTYNSARDVFRQGDIDKQTKAAAESAEAKAAQDQQRLAETRLEMEHGMLNQRILPAYLEKFRVTDDPNKAQIKLKIYESDPISILKQVQDGKDLGVLTKDIFLYDPKEELQTRQLEAGVKSAETSAVIQDLNKSIAIREKQAMQVKSKGALPLEDQSAHYAKFELSNENADGAFPQKVEMPDGNIETLYFKERLSASDRLSRRDFANALESLPKLRESHVQLLQPSGDGLLDKAKTTFAGRAVMELARPITASIDPEYGQFTTYQGAIGQTIAKAIEKGRLSDKDRAFYLSLIGNARDTREVFDAKMQAMDVMLSAWSSLDNQGQLENIGADINNPFTAARTEWVKLMRENVKEAKKMSESDLYKEFAADPAAIEWAADYVKDRVGQ